MAKPDPNKNIEVEPDAWERFERAVDVVAKSPPQPKVKKPSREGGPARKPGRVTQN